MSGIKLAIIEKDIRVRSVVNHGRAAAKGYKHA